MTKPIILVMLLFAFTSTNLIAQDSPEIIIKAFFDTYEKDGGKKALDDLYATNPWTVRVQDAINDVKTKFSRFDKDLVGEYYGYEKLVSKKLGESYALYTYFMKFDRQFLRVTFKFYKPNNEWRLASFKFDDEFDNEIEEAAKLYYLDLDIKEEEEKN